MNIKQFTLHLSTDVGIINEKKADKLQEVFKESFPFFGEGEDEPVHALRNREQGLTILLLPHAVIFNFLPEEDKQIFPGFDRIKSDLRLLVDTMLLDENCVGYTRVVGMEDLNEITAQKSSLRFLDQELIGKWPEIQGIGLRFFTKRGGDHWEFKLEPYVDDENQFFMEARCVHDASSLDDMIEQSSSAFDYFVNDVYKRFSVIIGK